jgi:hypothetical protein
VAPSVAAASPGRRADGRLLVISTCGGHTSIVDIRSVSMR